MGEIIGLLSITIIGVVSITGVIWIVAVPVFEGGLMTSVIWVVLVPVFVVVIVEWSVDCGVDATGAAEPPPPALAPPAAVGWAPCVP